MLRISRIRALAGAVSVLVAMMLGACGVDTSAIVVRVRDARTHEPAANVLVFADVPNKNHPLSVATLLGKTKSVSATGRTDANGRVELVYAPGRVVRLSVMDPHWIGGAVLIDPETVELGKWFAIDQPMPSDRGTPEYAIESGTASN